MEVTMWYRLSIVATATLIVVAAPATAAELPTFEVLGFPITPHQVAVIGGANVQEQSPTPSLTRGGMPASPHQVAVLTPRAGMTAKAAAVKSTTIGLATE
jgi:hypothetical protein